MKITKSHTAMPAPRMAIARTTEFGVIATSPSKQPRTPPPPPPRSRHGYGGGVRRGGGASRAVPSRGLGVLDRATQHFSQLTEVRCRITKLGWCHQLWLRDPGINFTKRASRIGIKWIELVIGMVRQPAIRESISFDWRCIFKMFGHVAGSLVKARSACSRRVRGAHQSFLACG